MNATRRDAAAQSSRQEKKHQENKPDETTNRLKSSAAGRGRWYGENALCLDADRPIIKMVGDFRGSRAGEVDSEGSDQLPHITTKSIVWNITACSGYRQHV